MGSIDWGSVGRSGGATGVPAGGVDWGAVGGVHPAAPPRVAQPHLSPLNRYKNVPGAHHSASIADNILGQISETISGIPNAVATVGASAWHDISAGKVHDERLNSWSFLAEHPIGYAEAWLDDPKTFGGAVVDPQVQATKRDANALRRGDWHYFQQNPLNAVIDVATVASLGGRAALGVAKTGAIGDRAFELAHEPRVLKVGDYEETLRQSRTLQGRIRQRAYDRLSMKYPDAPIIGVNARLKPILDRRINTEMIRAHLPLRAFQRATNQLSPAEVFAFHVAAEGVPLDERIAYYQARRTEILAANEKRAGRIAKRPPKTQARPPRAVRPIEDYLKNLEAPSVRDAIDNPRPEFIDALEKGAQLEGEAGRRLMEVGTLHPEARQERVGLPQREMAPPEPPPPPPYSGSTPPPAVPPTGAPSFTLSLPRYFWSEAKRRGLLGEHKFKAQKPRKTSVRVTMDEAGLRHLKSIAKRDKSLNHNSRRAVLQRIANQQKAISSAVERHSQRLLWKTDRKTGEWWVEGSDYRIRRDQEAFGSYQGDHFLGHDRSLPEAKRRIERDAHHRRTEAPVTEPPPAESAYTLPERSATEAAASGVNRVNPAFPAPYRFPHMREGVRAGQFMSPKTEAALSKAPILKQLLHNEATLLRNATYLTDPERVLSRDFLSTYRHLMIDKIQREALDKIAHDVDPTLARTGFKKPGEWYYRPSRDSKTTTPIPREVRLQETLSQDRSGVRAAEGDRQAVKAAHGIVSQDLHDLGIDARDMADAEALKAAGVRVIPAAYGKGFVQQFQGTHWAIRYFYDRPLDVWRAITLNYRPAWMVNNFIGNGLMGLLTYGPKGAAAYLRVLLTLERGEDKVLKLRNWTMRIPTLRRAFGEVFSEVAPEIHSAGLFGTQTKVTHLGTFEGIDSNLLARLAESKTLRAIGISGKYAGRAVLSVGRGVTKVEILLAEDTGREAAFIREAGGDLAKIRKTAKRMGEGNITLAEALKRLDRASVERAVQGVNDVLGDFNDLNQFERSFLRRVIPFYSWFKVITKVSGKYAARYPERVLLLKNIREAQDRSGEPALPSWLQGAILVGKPDRGVQTLVSTSGLNPYETLNQVSQGGPGSVLTPFAGAFITGTSGVDPAFGTLQSYYGPGDTQRAGWPGFAERAAGGFLGGLAPYRLYKQETQPYKGKLYAPKTYHPGGLSVDDWLLQYLGAPIRHVRVGEARRERGLR